MKKGVFFALITAAISGFSIFYNKQIVVKGIDPLIFNILKNGGVAIILSLMFLPLPKMKKLSLLSKREWIKLLLIGFIGGSIPFILYFEGLRIVSATNANLIHKTLFLWVAAMAIPILGEKLNLWQVIGYLLIAWANLFMGGFSGFSRNQGELMIFLATLLWSVENIIAKVALRDLDSHIVAWGRMFFGFLILLAISVYQNKLFLITKLTSDQILPIAGSIILLTGYVTVWYKALKHAPATVVTSTLILATPITNLLSVIFITHSLPQLQIINLFSTFFGVFLITFWITDKTKKLISSFND